MRCGVLLRTGSGLSGTSKQQRDCLRARPVDDVMSLAGAGHRRLMLARLRPLPARIGARACRPSIVPGALPEACWSAASTARLTAVASFKGTTARELEEWLVVHGVDTSCYGKGVSKTVEDLLEETSKNESVLDVECGRALRIVRVLSMHILNKEGKILFEQEQILPDGRSRFRNVALSEKLVGDEPWQEAVGRAVQEELGTALPPNYEVTLFPETYQLLSQVSTSMSYPNLPTKYIFHRVSAKVTGLPQVPFSTYEERPGGKLVTRWEWRWASEVQSEDSDMLGSS